MESTVSGDVTTTSSGKTQESPDLVSAILACLAIIGTASNAIVIYVFNRKKDKSVSTFFILTLAFIDFVICLVNIPFVIFMVNIRFKIRSDFICKTSHFLISANRSLSAFVMVAIAIDRYFCICHPFKRIMTVPRAKLLVASMAATAAAIGVCVSLTVSVNAGKPVDGMTKTRNEPTTGTYQWQMGVNSSAGLDVFTQNSSVRVSPVYSGREAWSAERRHNKIYTRRCIKNEFLSGKEFAKALRYFRHTLQLFCFVTVLIFYILIYRSVVLRRKTRHRQQKKKAHLLLTGNARMSVTTSCHSNTTPFVERSFGTSTTRSPSSDDGVLDSPSRIIRPRNTGEMLNPLSSESAAARVANLKTAAMLFVVTLVFAVSCLPSILMQCRLIPFNVAVFYMYFFHSVANPIIYSFMNRNFREKVKNLISRR